MACLNLAGAGSEKLHYSSKAMHSKPLFSWSGRSVLVLGNVEVGRIGAQLFNYPGRATTTRLRGCKAARLQDYQISIRSILITSIVAELINRNLMVYAELYEIQSVDWQIVQSVLWNVLRTLREISSA